MVAAIEHTPTVPTQAQDLAALQARLPAALAMDVVIEECIADPSRRPGANPRHVFDFPDGMRLIVSFDTWQGQPPILHVSASYVPDSQVDQMIRMVPNVGSMRLAAFVGAAVQHFQQLSGVAAGLKLKAFNGYVPHFFGPTREQWEAQR